ncbi:hypothetical protein ID866_11157 [Astraeus odoratus]|nr:hypothetical protein ID866_11157 [Astraeus odoratus]
MNPARALCHILLSLPIIHASSAFQDNAKVPLSISATADRWNITNIAKADIARANAMYKGSSKKRDASVYETNAGGVYTAQVGVGDPPTEYTLLLDTGSSNTWIGANPAHPYNRTDTSKDTGNSVAVYYGFGTFSGEEYNDTVSLGNGLTIKQQSIGVASSCQGFPDFVDGVLGLGPVGLTEGTVTFTNDVPTVVDNLYSQGVIGSLVLGVYFIPFSDASEGELTFGGYDDYAIDGSVTYVPVTTSDPASLYWGIDASISYNGSSILSLSAGIIDTATALILIADDAFSRYQSATGATLEPSTGLYTISDDQYNNIQVLSFDIGGISYNLNPNAQILPRSRTGNQIYLAIVGLGRDSNSGWDFTCGCAFLERYYTIIDSKNLQVGFARTHYTDSKSN